MKNIVLKSMTATEMFRQQVISTMQGIRYRNDHNPSTYLPLQMGGIFAQRDILAGGNVLRITEIDNGRQ